MQVAIYGSGYVGLVTGACLAEMGNHVLCVDIDEARVASLQRAEIPIFEPGLPELVRRTIADGRLSFTTDVAAAAADRDVIFSAVGTPPRDDGAANLSSVDAVAQTVAEHANRECVLVLKSTVPVGTHARASRLVEGASVPVHVASNPEFLKEGAAVTDFMRPDRVVVGIVDGDNFSRAKLGELYHPVCLDRDRIVWMDPASAELTKYVANTMLAMRISFMNEIAALCERVGADVHHVRLGVGSDGRIGPQFLYAGPGYGGSCFPKDVKALVHVAREHELELELAHATDRVNQRQKGVLARKVRALLGADLRDSCVAVWGLTFKPNTDDVREAPALTLIRSLVDDGVRVRVHCPQGMPRVRALLGDDVVYASSALEAAEGADCLVLATEWREYQSPDFERLGTMMRARNLVDGRNIWSKYALAGRGFRYVGVGVPGQG